MWSVMNSWCLLYLKPNLVCLLYKWSPKVTQVVLSWSDNQYYSWYMFLKFPLWRHTLSQTLFRSAFFTAYMTFELVMYVAKKMGDKASVSTLAENSSQFSSIANINGNTVLLSDLYLTPFSSWSRVCGVALTSCDVHAANESQVEASNGNQHE